MLLIVNYKFKKLCFFPPTLRKSYLLVQCYVLWIVRILDTNSKLIMKKTIMVLVNDFWPRNSVVLTKENVTALVRCVHSEGEQRRRRVSWTRSNERHPSPSDSYSLTSCHLCHANNGAIIKRPASPVTKKNRWGICGLWCYHAKESTF